MKKLLLIICFIFFEFGYAQTAEKPVEIQFLGRYVQNKGPCQWLPNGTKRCLLRTGFTVDKVEKGNLKVDYVETAFITKFNSESPLETQQAYRVTLQLTPERIQKLGLENEFTIMVYENPVMENEILSIKPIKE